MACNPAPSTPPNPAPSRPTGPPSTEQQPHFLTFIRYLGILSVMSDIPINLRLATRLKTLRAAAGVTLETIAERSGVSRSMISAIERAESSPTAVLLERLAAGLGVSLAALFDQPDRPDNPVARRGDQTVWRDPASGYVRRNVSPPGPSPIRIVEVEFPPGATVAYDTGPRSTPQHQQVWLLEGRIDVTVGPETHRLEAGDCLAFPLDRPTGFHNPGTAPARYAVIIVGGG
jgi:transcriptional regulator with XRE-family HTH domain